MQAGDTLSSISQRQYGTTADWPAVWWANRDQLKSPSLIQVGQRLLLPGRPQVSASLLQAAMAAVPDPPPASPPVASTVTSAAAPSSATYSAAPGSFQSCVIQAESGGNAQAVNPVSGAGGLYGFLPSTWQALGFSGLPENAPVSVQNAAFAKEYAQSGTSAWAAYDGC